MTIADLITAVRVGDPQVSPDGQRVAFVRTTTDSATGKRNADIWVVAADGSARPRPFIAGPGERRHPALSRRRPIAFISARERNAPGVPGGCLGAARSRRHPPLGRGAAPAGGLARRAAGGLRLRRLSRVCGRPLQRQGARLGGAGPGQAAPPEPTPLPALERLVGAGAASCLRHRAHRRSDARSHPRRLRQRRRTTTRMRRSRSRPTVGRSRSSRSGASETPRCGRRTTMCGPCP